MHARTLRWNRSSVGRSTSSRFAINWSSDFTAVRSLLNETESFVLFETTYDPSRHLRKEALKILEYEDDSWIVNVQKADGSKRRRGTFPPNCTITFADGF